MKNFTILLFLTASTTFFAQEYNIQDNYIAAGYDVVAYFNNNAVEGKNKFTTTYDGIKFKFSSEKNVAIFKKNPQKYIPQYGGFCAYAMGKDAERVSINPKTYEIRDGKLYLFYDSFFNNTFKDWKKEGPEKLQKKADENWGKLKNKS